MQEMKGLVIRPRYSLRLVIPLDLIALFMIYLMVINNRTEDVVAGIAVGCFYLLILLAPIGDYFWGIMGFFDQHYVVDSTGVTYYNRKKNYYLRWEDIQHIILYPDIYGRIKKHCFICFIATEGIPGNLSQWRNFNEKAFGIQYRPDLIEMIERLSGRKVELLDRLTH